MIYLLDVDLPEGLKTSYKTKLDFRQELRGDAGVRHGGTAIAPETVRSATPHGVVWSAAAMPPLFDLCPPERRHGRRTPDRVSYGTFSIADRTRWWSSVVVTLIHVDARPLSFDGNAAAMRARLAVIYGFPSSTVRRRDSNRASPRKGSSRGSVFR